jgi:pimeloyl-ACP methyl ester carboxylesterase
MGEYVQVGDVMTWYEVDGPADGDPLLLLHGGMGDGTSWGANAPAMAQHYRTFVPDRRGHGKTPDVDGPLTHDDMADDTIAFLEQVVGGPARLVGWSDGGIVSLLLSIKRPDLVTRQVLVGTNFHRDGLLPNFLLGDDPYGEDAAMFKAFYEAVAVDPAHWPVFFEKTERMWREEPTLTVEDLKRVRTPTLVLVGDDDAIHLEHTIALYEGIAGSQLCVVPGTSHVVTLEKAALFDELVLAFLAETSPPSTIMPIRRAGPS